VFGYLLAFSAIVAAIEMMLYAHVFKQFDPLLFVPLFYLASTVWLYFAWRYKHNHQAMVIDMTPENRQSL
jgi:hypothetical protein